MTKDQVHYTLTLLFLVFLGWLAFYSLTSQAAVIYTPQAGVYQKQLSNATKPRVRYVPITQEPTAPTQGLPLECALKFKCYSPHGVIYDLSQNYAMSCPKVFIKKNEVGEYDGTQIINGQPVCP